MKWYRELEAIALFLNWRGALLVGSRRAGRDPCESTRRTFAARLLFVKETLFEQ